MLAGQEVNFIQSVIISLTGMTIAFVELILLALIIVAFSKVLRFIKSRADKKEPAAPPAALEASQPDEDIAAIMTTVAEECGMPLEEIQFILINRVDT